MAEDWDALIREFAGERSAMIPAAKRLMALGPAAATAVPLLIPFLRDPLYLRRMLAIKALAAIGLASAPAAPALIEALGDASLPVREEAAWAVGVLGPLAGNAVPALIQALSTRDDENRFFRRQAAWALGEIGPAAEPALPTLRECAAHPHDGDLARNAARAIRRIPRDVGARDTIELPDGHPRPIW